MGQHRSGPYSVEQVRGPLRAVRREIEGLKIAEGLRGSWTQFTTKGDRRI